VREALGYQEQIDENWRGDTARYADLIQKIPFQELSRVGEIGANTGFFTLSLAHGFSKTVFYAYEINPSHVRFMQDVCEAFHMDNVVVMKQGVDSDHADSLIHHDLLLNYNVLHHAGVDFDQDKLASEADFQTYAVDYLRRLLPKATRMVFQMGSNWGGNKQKPLVPLDNDAGKIALNAQIFKQAGWMIEDIAIHTRKEGRLAYRSLDGSLIDRLQKAPLGDEKGIIETEVDLSELTSFSEFYRRPIFIVRSFS
jgi:hypothetical protein